MSGTAVKKSCVCPQRSRVDRADWCVDCPDRDSRAESAAMSEQKIQPATDKEIARWKAADMGLSIEGKERIYARIDADREKIAALEAELAELKERTGVRYPVNAMCRTDHRMILYDGQDWLDCPLCTVAREALK